MNHAGLGKELAESWGIPPKLIEAISNHHSLKSSDLDKELDLEYWKGIKDSKAPSDYENYLREFPKGKFAKIANARLEKLKEGDSVLIENYGTTGVLLEDPAGKKKVRVGLGNIETVIETIRLKGSLKKKRSKSTFVQVHNLVFIAP